jgi:hypothetical protein
MLGVALHSHVGRIRTCDELTIRRAGRLCLPKIPFRGFTNETLLHYAQNLSQYQFARDRSNEGEDLGQVHLQIVG